MVAEPTGLEHDTPVTITSTSATERAGFRKCRRQWLLTVVHRLDPQEGNVNFFLGTIYHKGLEAYYVALKDGASGYAAEAVALDAYQEHFDTDLARVTADLGFLAAFGIPAFRDAGELGFEMLQNYLERERAEPLLDEVIAVEFRVNVDIVDEAGKVVGVLSVQADVVGMKDGELTVVDHKTASRTMPSAHLDLDDQLTAEVYSWWKATGNFPDRVVYNVSMKKLARPPRLIRKDTALSKDKAQSTTPEMYRRAIHDNGFDLADYVDMLAFLDAREASGEDPLFRREPTFRTPGQMAAFERDLLEEWRDMEMVAANPSAAYPNPTSMNCGSCSVRAICTTIQDGGDVEAVIRGGYVVADPRR